MKMIRFFSYSISPRIPAYGVQEVKPEVRQLRSFERGDACQTYWIGMENHWGTHVDCPAHFFSHGKKVVDYEAGFWFFSRPQIVPVEAKTGEIITRRNLKTPVKRGTDLLLLKSGWNKMRGEKNYSVDNPGVDSGLGRWLRTEYPSVKAIGFDWISLSSYKNSKMGREAHRVFLDPEGKGHPIIIIEDMHIPDEIDGLREVWVVPLLIEAIDSAPCTVIGIYNDKSNNF